MKKGIGRISSILCYTVLVVLTACDKQGPMGPPGDPGPDGAGSAGVGNIKTYVSAENMSLTWQASDGWDNDVIYILNFNDESALEIPVSVIETVEEGGLFIAQMEEYYSRDWHQFPFLPQTREIYNAVLGYFNDKAYFVAGCRVNEDQTPREIRSVKLQVAPATEFIQIELDK